MNLVAKEVYAFDPGKTTGWASFYRRPEPPFGWYLATWGAFPTWKELGDFNFRQSIVVYERLRTNLPYFDPIGLEVAGVIQYLAEFYGAEIVRQTAGEISGLKQWPHLDPIKQTVKPIHAYEAALHGIKYIGRASFLGLEP